MTLTLSPTELWAFSTTAEDVVIRNALYERFGPVEARRRLAARYPGGSAKPEVERRRNQRLDVSEDAADVVREILQELISL